MNIQQTKKTLLLVVCFAFGFAAAANAQSAANAVEQHRQAAVAVAGKEYQRMLDVICPPIAAPAAPTAAVPTANVQREPADPPRAEWHADPMKVFDNLYFVGTQANGAWAVTTSEGIIVIDALYSYAVKDEVEDGLRKLGLDPKNIKYLVLTHAHDDHAGGAKYLQDTFKPRLVMGDKDWDIAERNTRSPRPRRDIVATDGQKLTLGDTTLTLYITPGHAPSTISLLFQVKDGGKTYQAMEWGGVSLTPGTPLDQLKAYPNSAARFEDLAVKAGAEVIITNHTAHDKTFAKLDALKNRKAGDLHPFVVGTDSVKRYMTGVRECGLSTLAAAEARQGK